VVHSRHALTSLHAMIQINSCACGCLPRPRSHAGQTGPCVPKGAVGQVQRAGVAESCTAGVMWRTLPKELTESISRFWYPHTSAVTPPPVDGIWTMAQGVTPACGLAERDPHQIAPAFPRLLSQRHHRIEGHHIA
jgi:hypothetical protein